jgi:membrane-bound lytic murein transglycosylase D
LVAAAYNRGVNGLLKDMARQHASSYYDMTFSLETERYLYKVISLKDLYENPSKYKLKWYRHRRVYYNYVTVSSTINDINAFALKHNISVDRLRELNPWLRGNKLTVPEKGNYKIAVSQK